MNVDESLKVDGAVVFWTLAEWADRQRLHDALASLGLGKFVPPKRAPVSVLKDALHERFPGHLVQALKKGDGYCVSAIERGEELNDYPLVCSARLDGPADCPSLRVTPYDPLLQAQVEEKMERYAGLVRGTAVTGTLTGVLNHLCGRNLRPQGAIYWLPGDRLPLWAQAAAAAEGAAAGGGRSAVYCIRHRLDVDAVRAVRDAVVTTVAKEAEQIERDVCSGELGVRGLNHRKEQAAKLREVVALYESLLNVTLSDLAEQAQRVETSASHAALLASVSVGAVA